MSKPSQASPKQKTMQGLASFLRRFPFLMAAAYLVYRLFQPKFSAGVVGILFNAEHEVLLVEHVFHPRIPWGLPGGWIGRNEDPAEAIARELHEELGLRVRVGAVVHIQRTETNHLDIAFHCHTEDSIGALSYELMTFQWVTLDQLPKLHRFHYEAIHHLAKTLTKG